MNLRRASAPLLVVAGLVACGTDASEPASVEPSSIGQASQAIFGGELDPDHPAVMLLFDQAGLVCTGTNVRSEDGNAFLVTAAHCVTRDLPGGGVALLPPEQLLVVPGDDFLLSPIAFAATGVAIDPGYVGGFAADDIAVVSFFTGDETPPAIEPLAAADDVLGLDDELLLIGYGDTEAGGINTQRRRVERSVAGLDDELVVYSQEDGSGACFGDSGGPALASLDGRERLAAVISGGVEDFGEAPCSSGIGVATRVSGYEGFLAAALDVLGSP